MFTGDDARLLTILADLTAASAENARLYQWTQELSITDGLTRLYLRRFFNQRLEEEIRRFQEFHTPFSLIILDLDHFKRINDRLGHVGGDQVLMQISELLRQEARVTDILCRYGGEEFALLLPYTPSVSAMIMAERIRLHVAQRSFPVLQEHLTMTVSIGVAGCPEHAQSAESVIAAADQALYLAKREGRNRAILCPGGLME
jgi:diguanylate cyclase (GGDEF)-like protein